VRALSQSKNLTESLIKALSEWVASQKIRKLNLEIKEQPLEFADYYSAESVRNLNRK
jgi:hypothetical protein